MLTEAQEFLNDSTFIMTSVSRGNNIGSQKSSLLTEVRDKGRHVPGSQPPFYLIPDPYQNKEDTPFISVVACGRYIPLSYQISFYPLQSQSFEKNAQYPGDPAEPWIQDPSGFLSLFMRFKSFHQRKLLSYKTL